MVDFFWQIELNYKSPQFGKSPNAKGLCFIVYMIFALFKAILFVQCHSSLRESYLLECCLINVVWHLVIACYVFKKIRTNSSVAVLCRCWPLGATKSLGSLFNFEAWILKTGPLIWVPGYPFFTNHVKNGFSVCGSVVLAIFYPFSGIDHTYVMQLCFIFQQLMTICLWITIIMGQIG